jgi:hypothetical protein
MLHHVDACAWAQEHFGGAVLGDKRRNERLVAIAQAYALRPGASIPKLFKQGYDVQATYDFFCRDEVTPEAIQAPHRRIVHERMSATNDVVLLIQDTSTLSWSGKSKVEGLGPVGNGRDFEQGFLLHTTIAARVARQAEAGRRPQLELLGVADQQFHVRAQGGKPAGETRSQRNKRWRESALWSAAVERIGAAPAGAWWIEVSDRESDVYDHLKACVDANHGFVVRANQDRGLKDHEQSRLFDAARQAPLLGEYDLALRGRKGRPARTARMSIGAERIELRPPARSRKLGPICCWVLRAMEIDPPEGQAGLEWVLLSDQPIDSFEDAAQVVGYYAARWVIEEFHMALKTGMGAELLQLEHANRLMASVALMSVVALRLVDLREHVRVTPDDPAELSQLDEMDRAILSKLVKRPLRTIKEVAYAIGRLGGHMPQNGYPGWRTMTDGLMQLLLISKGARLARAGEI